MNEQTRNDIITLLKAGYTKEEIKEMYKPDGAADPAPAAATAADPAPEAAAATDPAPAVSVDNASINMDALNKAFDGFFEKMNKTIEKINIQNSYMGANPEQSIEQMLANVVMPKPIEKKGE